jgi:hypothetical protein
VRRLSGRSLGALLPGATAAVVAAVFLMSKYNEQYDRLCAAGLDVCDPSNLQELNEIRLDYVFVALVFVLFVTAVATVFVFLFRAISIRVRGVMR